jgi:hypothetical protein
LRLTGMQGMIDYTHGCWPQAPPPLDSVSQKALFSSYIE